MIEKQPNPSLLPREMKQRARERGNWIFLEPNELYKSAKHGRNAIKMTSRDRGARKGERACETTH